MPTIRGQRTLVDVAKELGGSQSVMIDCLLNDNAGNFFRALPVKQINGWTEKFRQKTGRPGVGFRSLGGGISTGKGKRENKQEGVFLLSGGSEVDKQTADRDPLGVKAYRAAEDQDFLESMGHELSVNTFYGSDDDGPLGLLQRLKTSSATYVAGGASDEATSIYGVKLGPKKLMGLYNTGEGGDLISAKDYGAVSEKTGDNLYEYYRTVFNATFGLAQYHPKAIGRIGRLDASNKPTRAHFTSLFQKMGWKPDLLVTTWTGYDWICELKATLLHMTPGDKDFDFAIDRFLNVPIMIEGDLSDTEAEYL